MILSTFYTIKTPHCRHYEPILLSLEVVGIEKFPNQKYSISTPITQCVYKYLSSIVKFNYNDIVFCEGISFRSLTYTHVLNLQLEPMDRNENTVWSRTFVVCGL